MIRILFVLSFLLVFCPAKAQEGIFNFGLKMQGKWDLAPGQDLYPGFELGYSNYNLFEHQLEFKFKYLTSRLEESFRKTIPREDYFLLGSAWHFRRKFLFDPYVKLDLGYTRFDTEGLDLANDSYVVATTAGLNLNLFNGVCGLYYDFGFSIMPFLTKTSSQYPGVFNVGIWHNL